MGFRNVKNGGCGFSTFAVVGVDFEPAETYEFVDNAPAQIPERSPGLTDDGHWADILRLHAEDDRRFKDAFADAMRADLGEAAIRVVLTRFVHHTLDSSEQGFAAAAHCTVRELHHRVQFELAEPVRGVHARKSGTYVRGDSYFSEITVDFEPAKNYEFVSRVDGRQAYVDAVDEVFRIELGTPPVRVILTRIKHRNVDEDAFGGVVMLAVRKVRKHLRERATPAEAVPSAEDTVS
ncbi:hypothetical protein [Actinomadura sp. NBRC 104425]|uniref:hypothetical protein n=1 Tax=Actinomadura sp. NBRC 104425 TaxID=3032204 RepID=UPI0025579F7D|nr:hypothetical protein [Actinomadura sp. NBRC 104425]